MNNKDALYFAVFAVLCVLAGVLVGASITKKTYGCSPMTARPGFTERAEKFMGYGPDGSGFRGHRHKGRGLFSMLVRRLDLDQTQQAKVKEILAQTRREIEKVGEGVRDSINEIRENSDRKIMRVLTPQQQEKFKTLKEETKRHCPRQNRDRRYGHQPRHDNVPETAEELPPPPDQE